MPDVGELCEFLHRLAPLDLAEEWDNVGLLVGSPQQAAHRVMTCLTVTPETVEEAVREAANLVVVHHPFPFHAVRRITDDTPVGQMLLRLIRADVAVYSAHTAFDSAARGINQQLAEAIGCTDIRPLIPRPDSEPGRGAARFGTLVPHRSVAEVMDALRACLGPISAQITAGRDLPLTRIAVACGSGASFIDAACRKACDALVVGEAGFHACLEAQARGLRLLLLGHYASERFAMVAMAERLKQQFPQLAVWASRGESDPLEAC